MAKVRRRKQNRRRGGAIHLKNRHHFMNRHHRRRAKKNPFGVSPMEIVIISGSALVGGVATRAIPQAVLSANNSGAVGYLMNLITAGVLGWLGGFISPSVGLGAIVGGVTATGSRIFSDLTGKSIISFVPGGTGGLGSDMAFQLGDYVPDQYVLPSTDGSGLVLSNPSALAVVAAGGKGAPVVAVTPSGASSGGMGMPSEWAPAW